ncbi:hypothetical protein [Stetteria hydrogenophila]
MASCTLVIAGFEFEVTGRARGGGIPVSLLELDAEYGVYGERLAGLLLAGFKLDCGDEGLESRVAAAARAYRRRVAAEQVHDFALRLGPMASHAVLRPSYVAVSRMSILSGIHGCRYEEYLSRPGALEELDRLYEPFTAEVAEPAGGGWYRPRPLRAREAVKAFTAALRGAGARAARAAPRPLALVEACPARGVAGILGEPWRLARIPEGELLLSCSGAARLASRYVGEPVECKAPWLASSTLVCTGAGGRVAVKEYYRMAFKWAAVRPVAVGFVRYRVTPKSRLAAEYRYLRLLRPIAGTPRVHGVCLDYAYAAMAREYVEGSPVLASRDPGDWRLAATLLASIHRAGYAVGDPNPGNIIVSGGRARLIDAEQARGYTPRAAAWDLAVFAVHARIFRVPMELVEEALKAYREASGSLWGEVSRILASPRIWVNLAIAPVEAFKLQRLARRLRG